MKGQGGGGTARGGGRNVSKGGSDKIVKTEARKTKDIEESILVLRQALFNDNGKDKNVTSAIAPLFMQYNRNGLDCEITFAHKLTDSELDWAFTLTKSTMEERYDASGYGWDDEDKEQSFIEPGTRFLLVKEKGWDTPIAFAHFRFSVQGEIMEVMKGEPSLFLWDIHVEPEFQRKGLGKHLLTVLELIARQQKMKVISIPVQLKDDVCTNWINKMKGYSPDNSLRALLGFECDMEGFEVYAKYLTDVPKKVEESPKVESVFTAASGTQDENKINGEKVVALDSNDKVIEAVVNSVDKLSVKENM